MSHPHTDPDDREIRRRLAEIDRELARQNRLLRAAVAAHPALAAKLGESLSFQLARTETVPTVVRFTPRA